jgi:hypothetical protein
MKLSSVSWEEVARLCESLASTISSSGFSPDVLVGVSRGGLVPVRLLSDLLGVGEIYTIRVSFYKSVGKTADFPRITQPLTERLEGKAALLVDDVSDTGRSLLVAKDHVKRMGAEDVKVATLHLKPHSTFRPDFFVGETGDWLVYPWERHESAKELGKKVSEL